MLPVYNGYQFQRILAKGGRTQPWVVLVNESGQLVPYVVKMFKAELVHKMDSVTNEVLGSVLANEFDLPIPKSAFIELDSSFYQTIDDDDALERYDFVDKRIKFGTKLLYPSIEYQPQTYTTAEVKVKIDIDTVYAFDSLIKNADRNNSNPNMRVSGNNFYLLDHDLGFQISERTAKEQLNLQSLEYINRYHIFYDYLYSSWAKSKEQFFYTFEEYLRRLNLKTLDKAFKQLKYYGFSTHRHEMLKEYFEVMKENSSKFATLMRHRITL